MLSASNGPYLNPFSPWSVGYTTNDKSAVIQDIKLFNASGIPPFKDYDGFHCYYQGTAATVSVPNFCQYLYSDNKDIPYGSITLFPPAVGFSVLRFTAPQSGTYRVTAEFVAGPVPTPFFGGVTYAYVSSATGVLQAFEPIASPSSWYSNAGIFLYKGQYVDFVVGPDGDGNIDDRTPLNVLVQDTRCIGATGSTGK